MSLVSWSSLTGAAILGAAALGGCSGGGGGVTGGGGTGTTTSTSASTSATSSSSGGGAGGSAGFQPSGFSCSPKARSLNSDVVPITQSSCSKTAACHLAMVSSTGVIDQSVNRVAEECDDIRLMVNPGNPESSYVIHKLTNHNLCSPATTMPLNSPTLPASEIQTIYDWICQGAPSN